MTEEIKWFMIRFFGIPPEVVRWELDWLDKDGWRHYHPHTGDMSMIEPAPPKDWRPVCFQHCGGIWYLTSECKKSKECEECPYGKGKWMIK